MKIKIMIDANVLIHILLKSDIIQKDSLIKLFKEKEKYQFVTTTRIIDEVIFKLIVISSGKNLKQLKKDKELLKNQIYIIEIIQNFLRDFEFKVYEIKQKHYWKMSDIIQEYGLLGNDALTMIIMKENDLIYLATLDTDFENTYLKNILKGQE